MIVKYMINKSLNQRLRRVALLALKALITTAADDIHKYFLLVLLRKLDLIFSSESSARQRIHMKNQALFSSKVKSKKIKCRLLQFLFGALRGKAQSRRLCALNNNLYVSIFSKFQNKKMLCQAFERVKANNEDSNDAAHYARLHADYDV